MEESMSFTFCDVLAVRARAIIWSFFACGLHTFRSVIANVSQLLNMTGAIDTTTTKDMRVPWPR